MTDDIRHTPDGGRADLMVVGGLTVDVLPEGTEVAGGAARYATEAALAAGMRVILHTASGDEPVAAAALAELAARSTVIRHPAPASIRFEHHGADGARRLRLRARTPRLTIPDPTRLPPARAVLFAPVADEVAPEALSTVAADLRAAGIQGWLRATDADGWVEPRALGDLPPDLTAALRRMDLLVCSHQDLGAADGPSGLARLREGIGPGPELVVTAGIDGAWLDDGTGPPALVPAEIVEGRATIGAGDAFAAVLVARRGAGGDLRAAAESASAATARYLATRPAPGVTRVEVTGGLAPFDGTAWRVIRFGPALATTPPPDAEFSLEIIGERLAGRSGCNRYMGGWTVAEDGLHLGPLATTMMFCHGLMDLERGYLIALDAVRGVRREGDRLLLTDADGQPLAELTPSPSGARAP